MAEEIIGSDKFPNQENRSDLKGSLAPDPHGIGGKARAMHNVELKPKIPEMLPNIPTKVDLDHPLHVKLGNQDKIECSLDEIPVSLRTAPQDYPELAIDPKNMDNARRMSRESTVLNILGYDIFIGGPTKVDSSKLPSTPRELGPADLATIDHISRFLEPDDKATLHKLAATAKANSQEQQAGHEQAYADARVEAARESEKPIVVTISRGRAEGSTRLGLVISVESERKDPEVSIITKTPTKNENEPQAIVQDISKSGVGISVPEEFLDSLRYISKNGHITFSIKGTDITILDGDGTGEEKGASTNGTYVTLVTQ